MKRTHLKYETKSFLGTRIPLRFEKEQTRNELCACGSKLKYKNCCGKKDALALQARMMTVNP